MRKSSIYSYL
jgi:hypothetical protein